MITLAGRRNVMQTTVHDFGMKHILRTVRCRLILRLTNRFVFVSKDLGAI